SGCRGGRSGLDALFVLITGLAQMGMDIDQSGGDEPPMRLDDFERCLQARSRTLPGHVSSIGTDIDDFAGLDEEVSLCIELCTRIDDSAAANQEPHARCPPLYNPGPPARRYNKAMRRATPLATWSRINE